MRDFFVLFQSTICHVKGQGRILNTGVREKDYSQGFHEPLVIKKNVVDESLCVLTTLNLYLKKTVSIRDNYKALFISAKRHIARVCW